MDNYELTKICRDLRSLLYINCKDLLRRSSRFPAKVSSGNYCLRSTLKQDRNIQRATKDFYDHYEVILADYEGILELSKVYGVRANTRHTEDPTVTYRELL